MRWRKQKALEHDEQVAYFDWVWQRSAQDWRFKTIYAIPNGGFRTITNALSLRREGVKAGVWDIHIPIRSGRFIGAWIEMKRPGGKLSDRQLEFGRLMQDAGHLLDVSFSATSAIEFTEYYFSLRASRSEAA